MEFNNKKEHILREIEKDSQFNDASPKGSIDSLCFPLINLINSHPDLVTTSSCSGRVSVFIEGEKLSSGQIGAKGNGGRWLFVSHEKADLENWWIDLISFNNYNNNTNQQQQSHNQDITRYVLFKYEPVIFHIKCRDFQTASKLYSTAMACGFRESGIGSNNNVAIRISIRLDVPIGIYNDNNNHNDSHDSISPLVNEDYIKVLTKLAHDRFLENERKMETLYNKINDEIVNPPQSQIQQHLETKEERKIRKIQEGMARRDNVRKEKEEKKRLKALEQQQVQQ